MGKGVLVLVATLLAGLGLAAVGARGADVLTYHNDMARTGLNTNETVLTLANVVTNSFGKVAAFPVDGAIYAQPLVISGVSLPGQGTRNLVIVATEHDSVYAFDANAPAGGTNAPLWKTSFLGPGVTPVPSDVVKNCGLLVPEIGITATPVIDPYASTVYVVAYTMESTDTNTALVYRLHALDITTGAEQSGSPVVIAGTIGGSGDGSTNGQVSFLPETHLSRAALLLESEAVYVAFGAQCDNPPFHGWLFSFSTQPLWPSGVFCSTPNGEGGGIWQSGGGPACDGLGHIFFLTGNGSFAPPGDLGESFVKLLDYRLQVWDYFAPFNNNYLTANDLDLCGGVVLLPDEAGSLAHPHVMVGADKQGTIYLVDRDNLGQFSAAADTNIVQELPGSLAGGGFDTPAYFNQCIYYLGAQGRLMALPLKNGQLDLSSARYGRSVYGPPGATPSVSANGTNNAIVWAIDAGAFATGGPAVLHAYNATNVTQELYNSSLLPQDAAGGAVKTSVPTIANGRVYVGTQTELSVYGVRWLPPTLRPIGFVNGAFEVEVSGQVSGTYLLEGSTDLKQWTVLSTNRPGASPFYFLDSNASALPWRFYRAVQYP